MEKHLTFRPKKWSRSVRGGGRLLEVLTIRLWLGKFWCFGWVVAYVRWSHMEFWLYFKWNVIKSSLPTNAVCGERRNTSSPKNACVGGYHTSGKETTLMNSIFFVLGLSEVGRVWGIEALFDRVFLQLWSVAAECSGEDCFGDDWVSWKQVSEWIKHSWFESSVERLNPKLRVSKEVMLLP